MLPVLTDLNHFRSLLSQAPAVDPAAVAAAEQRNGQLTKPPGALARLEELAIWYGGWRQTGRPVIESPQVVIFAGNHGITAQGVSAFPPEVTAQMVGNFEHGGAAINQLAALAGARLDVQALQLDQPTQDFTKEAALDEAGVMAALQAGWGSVDPVSDLLVVGEMGIGNTTSAAALAFALYGGEAEDWTGRGPGLMMQGCRLRPVSCAKASCGIRVRSRTGWMHWAVWVDEKSLPWPGQLLRRGCCAFRLFWMVSSVAQQQPVWRRPPMGRWITALQVIKALRMHMQPC